MDMQKSRKMWVNYMNANESFNISLPFTGHIAIVGVWCVSHLSPRPHIHLGNTPSEMELTPGQNEWET